MFTRIHVQALCAVLFLLASGPAFAVCMPTHAYEVYVGDTASDSACTYNSIQAALDATYTCPTTVRITRQHLYTSQHLSVSDKNLTLQGEADGVTCYQLANCIPQGGCHPDTSQPLVTIDGSNTAGSVLTITGNSNITLRDLTIEHGVAGSSGSGGGIDFSGSGSLTLDTTSVILNTAGYGGGVNVNGSSGPATLTLKPNTLILNNTAQVSGGGIRVEGNTRLFVLRPQTLIAFNHAPDGYGGGIEVLSPARADVASPGYNGAAVIQFNDAQHGGGIAALGSDSNGGVATVRLFTTDSHNPVQVTDNSASATGGGAYLKPSVGDGFADALLCAFDFRINDNLAQEGSALYADEDHRITQTYFGSALRLNGDASCGPESPPVLGAVACDPSVPCNEISRNIAEDSNGTPAPGSAILVQDGGRVFADRLLMRGNQGAHAIRTFGAYIDSYVHNCLIADNEVTGELVRIDNDGNPADPTGFVNCTFANNAIGGDTVIYSGHGLGLTDMIIDQPGVPTLAYSGDPAELSVSYVLSNDTSTLPVATGVIQGEPAFVDAVNGDYHLQVTSLGVDFAPDASGTDLNRKPRSVDLPGVPNEYGPLDLGAYEIQRIFACGTSDTIFCDGFETP